MCICINSRISAKSRIDSVVLEAAMQTILAVDLEGIKSEIDLCLSILGSETGNLALKLYARGGIY